ncbi:uncharacterized protein LOC113350649 [Papaver somniferum]|uniref:uncharacterized protein LOC113350649 n=1 Tax=Papaver somniferum TaxID=3469 RepID=UPI000E6F89DF|nr:uncharacterized protein LOC113350649 [Papaver somniferum]
MWLQKYTAWGYNVGLRIASDHSPLLGCCASIPKPSNVPFKFQKMWISHPQFLDVVKDLFGNIHKQIKEAETQVQASMLKLDTCPLDTNVLEELGQAENIYNSREVQLSTLLKKKYKIRWIKDGATNTDSFHTSLKIRQARNCISELEDANGDIITDQKKIAETLIHHFEKKIEYKEIEKVDSLLEATLSVITEEDQQMLDAIPNEEEINNTLFNMDPDSSPGLNGFSGSF